MVDGQIVVGDESFFKAAEVDGVVFAKENKKFEELQLFDKMPEPDSYVFVVKENECSHANSLWKSNLANAQGAQDLGRRLDQVSEYNTGLNLLNSSNKYDEYYVHKSHLSGQRLVRLFRDPWHHSLFRKLKMERKSRESYHELPPPPPEPPPLLVQRESCYPTLIFVLVTRTVEDIITISVSVSRAPNVYDYGSKADVEGECYI